MIIKTYQQYLIKSLLKNIFLISCLFLILSFLLNILEEIKFFKNLDLGISYSFLLTFLNVPSILYEIFPFIFLISTQMFFVNLFEKEELIVLKKHGVDNLVLIKILIITSLVCGILIVSLFYTISAQMKHSYLSFKNKFTDDKKYLAVVNENGLWIKDEVDNSINIINAEIFENDTLKKLIITQMDKDFNIVKTIIGKSANIQKNTWKIKNVEVHEIEKSKVSHDQILFKTNFNKEKLNNIFSNLTSLTFFELLSMSKDYNQLGYSTLEINSHLHKLYSFPIYLMIMSLVGGILMLNIKYNKSKIVNITIGIILSVIIYYLNYFINLLGTNEKLPIIISIWLPHLILFLFCLTFLIRINEN
ncbi:MAG TPA: YjgP/YjgQ family permease [Candidatus Pelagibacter sp.]|jgi:lipopolysaccharide export system permease protein|nr:YjgP/YjgQ family permease [Candidatus Pelagibacter sp.]